MNEVDGVVLLDIKVSGAVSKKQSMGQVTIHYLFIIYPLLFITYGAIGRGVGVALAKFEIDRGLRIEVLRSILYLDLLFGSLFNVSVCVCSSPKRKGDVNIQYSIEMLRSRW